MPLFACTRYGFISYCNHFLYFGLRKYDTSEQKKEAKPPPTRKILHTDSEISV